MVLGGDNATHYNPIPWWSRYKQKKGTLAKSDCERRRNGYNRGAHWEPRSDNEQSSRTNRYRGPQREPEEQDRSRTRSERSTLKQTKRGRESSTEERAWMRKRRHAAKCLADLPTQIKHPSNHQYKGKSHPRLPICSLAERCTHAEQHRRWLDNMPTRGMEVLDKTDRWIKHFKAIPHPHYHTQSRQPRCDTVVVWIPYRGGCNKRTR